MALKMVAFLSIFTLSLTFSLSSIAMAPPSFSQLLLPSSLIGPESFAFDSFGNGPYTGVSDGRVLLYEGPNVGFVEFSFSRSKEICDGTTTDPDHMGPICGRPLGLGFNASNHLYVADAYFGLLVVGSRGRLATQLATAAEGVPFRFLDGLDVHPVTGLVYFTDASSVYQLRNISQAIASKDATGRLLKYEAKTNQVTVLLRGLSGPAGVAVSIDGTFLLVTEYIGNRIQKFWLKGPKANTSEIIVTLQGSPDNIKRNLVGDFWVAVSIKEPATSQTIVPTAIRINAFGTILETVPLNAQYNSMTISEVQHFRGNFFIGSLYANFVGVYRPI